MNHHFPLTDHLTYRNSKRRSIEDITASDIMCTMIVFLFFPFFVCISHDLMLDLSYAIFFILDERTVGCIYDGTRGKLTIDNAVCHGLYDNNEKNINETEFGMTA